MTPPPDVSAPRTLRARLIFPVDRPPLAGGTITIAGERIVALGRPPSGAVVEDLGHVAIVPGLVNAHTHLEFSGRAAPLGAPGLPLPEWIGQVIEHRRAAKTSSANAIDSGLAEASKTGTTTVGEISTLGWPPPGRLRAHVTVFHESIGLAPDRIESRLAAARDFLDGFRDTADLRPGLSPHAPYTVHPQLLSGLVALARQRKVPMAMHLAESCEELELLADHRGPFRELLDRLGAWSDGAIALGSQPLDYLRTLAGAPRALVIHGNYLDSREIDFLAAHAECMSLVYCPRTHAFFGHERYPLSRLLDTGVRVALGTDSRASSPDLSMLAEMRFAAACHESVAPRQILELGTLAGARALGLDQQCGTLAVGKLANLAVVQLPSDDARDPHELLFDAGAVVRQTWHRGQPIDTGPGAFGL